MFPKIFPRLGAIAAVWLLWLGAAQAGQAARCTLPPEASAMASRLLADTNALRVQSRLPALRYDPVLSRAAQQHACDMALNGLRSHRGSDGSTVQIRARRHGFRACTIAENIAWDYRRVEQVAEGWAASSGHRANMLHPRVVAVGVGLAQGARGPSWVLVLARGC